MRCSLSTSSSLCHHAQNWFYWLKVYFYFQWIFLVGSKPQINNFKKVLSLHLLLSNHQFSNHRNVCLPVFKSQKCLFWFFLLHFFSETSSVLLRNLLGMCKMNSISRMIIQILNEKRTAQHSRTYYWKVISTYIFIFCCIYLHRSAMDHVYVSYILIVHYFYQSQQSQQSSFTSFTSNTNASSDRLSSIFQVWFGI